MIAVYCLQCRVQLKTYGGVAETVYDHVCEWYVSNNKAVEIDQNEIDGIQCGKPIIDFLEKKGFILTTESGKQIVAIKPTIIREIHEEILYLCSGRH